MHPRSSPVLAVWIVTKTPAGPPCDRRGRVSRLQLTPVAYVGLDCQAGELDEGVMSFSHKCRFSLFSRKNGSSAPKSP